MTPCVLLSECLILGFDWLHLKYINAKNKLLTLTFLLALDEKAYMTTLSYMKVVLKLWYQCLFKYSLSPST